MDIKKNTWKSHVLLTRQLLKPYAFKVQNEGKYVNILDLKSNEIKKEKINNLDAELKYYNQETEYYLDKEVENSFGVTVNKINNLFIRADYNINLEKKDLENIRRFFQYSFLRNKKFFRKARTKINNLIPLNFTHNDLLHFAPSIDEAFQNKRIFILQNPLNNKDGFVTPHSVVFELDSCMVLKTKPKIFLLGITVNPNIILCITPIQSKTDHVDIIKLEDKDVQQINKKIYSFELNRKNDVKYIVGKKDDLLKLKNHDY